MKRQHPNGLGLALLALGGLILGSILLGKLFKLALVAGAVFVVWKLFFGREEKGKARVATQSPSMDLLPPLHVGELEPDPERVRLDRELDAAIAAAAARRSAAAPTS